MCVLLKNKYAVETTVPLAKLYIMSDFRMS